MMPVSFTPIAPPVGESFSDQLVQRFEPWLSYDLRDLLQAVAGMFAEVELYAFDVETDDDFYEGWTLLFDPARCPLEALPYLAQIVGERLPIGLDEASLRQLIVDAPHLSRGTPSSVFAATQRHLTGTRSVFMQERYLGVVDQVAIRTNAAETPNATQTRADILSVLPADVILDYQVVTGATWDDVKAANSWTAAKTKTWSELVSALSGWTAP